MTKVVLEMKLPRNPEIPLSTYSSHSRNNFKHRRTMSDAANSRGQSEAVDGN